MRVIKKKLPLPIIKADDDCATLLSIEENGTFIYEFRFYAFATKAIASGANIVRISIRNELPSSAPNPLDGVKDFSDVKSFVDGVLKLGGQSRDAKRDVRNGIVAATSVDLTAKVDNGRTSSMSRGDVDAATDVKRTIKMKSVSELKQASMDVAVMQTNVRADFKATQAQAQASAIDLVLRGIDPTVDTSNPARGSGAFSAMAGYAATVTRSSLSISSTESAGPIKLRQDALNSAFTADSIETLNPMVHLADDARVPVIVDTVAKYILNARTMRVFSGIGFDDFYVVFELVDSDGAVIETVSKRIAHSAAIRAYNTPTIAPRIAIAPAQFPGKNVIELTQIDPKAVRIRVLRRPFRKIDVSFYDSSFDTVAEIPLKKGDGLYKFIDIVNNSSILLYRCIAIGPGGLIGSEFSNGMSIPVASRTSSKSHRSLAATIVTKIVNGGIQIDVTKVPNDVAAVAIVRRNLTLHETSDQIIETVDPIRVVGASAGNLTFIDSDVKQEHTYEYRCMLFYEDGLQTLSTAYSLKLYRLLSVGIATISISNVDVINANGGLDVRFSVTSTLSDEGLSIVKKILEQQGSDDIYRDELRSEREKLEKLLAHTISRIDMSTGLEESFGVIVGSSFSDAVNGVKNGVSKLRPGRKYRYIISTLLRDAETMFDKLEKQAVDPSTGKQYTFKPAFSRHPITLSRGTIVTRESLRSNHPEDDFMHGHVGNSHEIDISIPNPTVAINDVRSFRLDRRSASVKWTVVGPIDKIDHFVVVKERLGQSTVVGKMHGVSTTNTFEYFDRVTPDDIGDVTYKVVPVLTDFSHATEAISNKLSIEDKRGRF